MSKSTKSVGTAVLMVLPPTRFLPQGHLLVTCIDPEGNVTARKDKTPQGVVAFSTELSETMTKATAAGFQVELVMAAHCHYKNTIQNWKNDPTKAIEFVKSWIPKSQQNEQEMPF